MLVPFELGRPLGAPNEPDFQRRVLRQTLELLERTDGPILDEFPDPPPGPPADTEGWTCPVNFGPGKDDIDFESDPTGALKQERETLRSWYDLALEQNGKTTVGVSGLELDVAVSYIAAFMADPQSKPPRADIEQPQILQLCIDDMKAYYYMAGAARPGAVSDKELADWYYGDTFAGRLLLVVNQICAESDDPILQTKSIRRIIPIHQQHLKQTA